VRWKGRKGSAAIGGGETTKTGPSKRGGKNVGKRTICTRIGGTKRKKKQKGTTSRKGLQKHLGEPVQQRFSRGGSCQTNEAAKQMGFKGEDQNLGCLRPNNGKAGQPIKME